MWRVGWGTLRAMARPLRIEFEGAWYHVMSSGNERRRIVKDDTDRARRLDCRPCSDASEIGGKTH